MKLIVKKPFSWAHRNVDVQHYEPGQEIETDDKDLIAVATSEGWVKPGKGGAAARDADPTGQSAPENAASANAPETKAAE